MKDSIFTIDAPTPIQGDIYFPETSLYKGFTEAEHRESFLNGNVWFAGPSTNRMTDIWEYRSSNSITLHLYGLSLSKIKLPEYSYHLKISNTGLFFYHIKNILLESNLEHAVSWHTLNDLKQFSSEVPSINMLTEDNYFPKARVKFVLNGFWAERLTYENKKNSEQDIVSINNPIEAAKKSYNKNDEFRSQEEHRLVISSIFTDDDTACLDKAVRHLKIKCPLIKDYCQIVN